MQNVYNATYKRLVDNAQVPTYGTPDSAAFDFSTIEDLHINPKTVGIARTGLVIKPPPGQFLLMAARSSLFKRRNCILINGVGIIDPDYCGEEDEIMCQLYNLGDSTVIIPSGERVAQGLLLPTYRPNWVAESFMGKSRGGLGSTGA